MHVISSALAERAPRLRRVPGLIAAVLLAAAAGSAGAATTTSTFTVTATVLKYCSVSATNLAFGNYTPSTGALTNTSTVTYACTNGTAITSITLNVGTTTGATMAQRLMTNGTSTLQYNLYTSNAYSSIWGDGTGGSVTQAGTTGSGLANTSTLTVYGKLPDSTANQAVTTGSYSDTITVTVNY
jgi:spore coat protein U-like protein